MKIDIKTISDHIRKVKETSHINNINRGEVIMPNMYSLNQKRQHFKKIKNGSMKNGNT
tara:strand:- start:17 stop:190 length:174 start_codon:yes stop_codon:yes gene_type:complete